MSPLRTPGGGSIDRTRSLAFTFDGRAMTGHPGDTLASALLANGVRVVGRSFKYHRPRGVMSAGVEEPNALVGVGAGGRFEPNTRATDVYLYDGVAAVSQNRWPSLAFDLGAVNGLIAPFIPAGFYYKTFLGAPRLWKFYERFIRAAAGLGRPPAEPDADAFEHRAAFCDVLIVGAGPAGLAAALAATAAGARVILVEQDRLAGGGLLRDPAVIDGQASQAWIGAATRTITAAGGRVLTRTTAFGYHDHDLVTLCEKLVEPGQPPPTGEPAQRLWRVRASRVVLATGALERTLLFANNDRPGVMLSRAMRDYIRRFGVLPGRRIVLATCHDDAYRTADAIADAGGEMVAILDARSVGDASPRARAAAARFPVRFDAHLLSADRGAAATFGVQARVGRVSERFAAEGLGVCGGFAPVVSLHMQAGGELLWDEAMGAFTPTRPRQRQISAGAASGARGLAGALSTGWRAGDPGAATPGPRAQVEPLGGGAGGTALFPRRGVDLKKTFVDPQNDVTLADLDLAWREGYRSIEHLKRYTTVGMATDQGKNSNIIALARLAHLDEKPVAAMGVTTFRPPYTPVTLGALAGPATGSHAAHTRRSPLWEAHQSLAPAWQPSGCWMRPRAYPHAGESVAAAALREARTVRSSVGFVDVSTLGKFEVAGPDAARLLERVCATPVAKLAIGRGRYTFMLREDGLVFDDGTVWRLASDRYLLTSSTGGAERMDTHIAYVRAVLEPGLRVAVANVQEHWGAIAMAGPRARDILGELADVTPPRHMAAVRATIAEIPTLILAASFSGERAFEVYAPGAGVAPVWAAIARAAAAVGGAPYGLEALDYLRIEKGHLVVGAEIDGRTTPADLGLARMLRAAGGYVGWQNLRRPALSAPDRRRLVGLEADEGMIPEGSMLLTRAGAMPEGHVTAAGPRLGGEGGIALALLRGGPDRLGEALIAHSPTRGRTVGVRVVEPVFFDPAGEAYRD